MTALAHVQAQEAITFTIPGDPVGWARARSNGKMRFTAPKQSASLAQIGLLAKSAMRGRAMMTGPVSVEIDVIFAYPASWRPKQRARAWWHTSKPDLDNLSKQVCDGISGIVFKDDAQVAVLECCKTYGDVARVSAKITELEVGVRSRLAKQGRDA